MTTLGRLKYPLSGYYRGELCHLPSLPSLWLGVPEYGATSSVCRTCGIDNARTSNRVSFGMFLASNFILYAVSRANKDLMYATSGQAVVRRVQSSSSRFLVCFRGDCRAHRNTHLHPFVEVTNPWKRARLI